MILTNPYVTESTIQNIMGVLSDDKAETTMKDGILVCLKQQTIRIDFWKKYSSDEYQLKFMWELALPTIYKRTSVILSGQLFRLTNIEGSLKAYKSEIDFSWLPLIEA